MFLWHPEGVEWSQVLLEAFGFGTAWSVGERKTCISGYRIGDRVRKGLKYLFFLSVPAAITALVMVELALRFIIPASTPPHTYFDTESNVLRLDVAGPRTGLTTIGNLAQQRSRWRVNNMGWNSEVDYATGERDKPLIAIIGDSFVQALDVTVQDSIASRLREAIGGRYDVYSFGKGGAALSQYLHLSRYVTRTFSPEVLVFNVVGNDFDESLCDTSYPVGMMCLRDRTAEIQEAEIIPYVPSRLQRLARKSSLIRYVVFNLKISPAFRGTGVVVHARQQGAAFDQSAEELRRERVERSTDYVLRKLAEENPDRTVLFIIDGPRQQIYAGDQAGRDEFALWASDLLKRKSQDFGFAFLDLAGPFSKAFQEDGQRFESKFDYHWNAHGHAVAAQSLQKTLQEIGAVPP